MKAIRILLLGALVQPAVALAAVKDATVERTSPTRLAVRWTDDAPVAVYVSTDPEATPATATPVAAAAHGAAGYADVSPARRYFLLRDTRDGTVVRVAERSVPLERGSNFRDVGGYRAAGGKTVRWGRIYRSGAMPMLTEADYARLGTLGIGSIIDLRSIEEREVAPDQLDDRTGALFLSNDYSLRPLMARFQSQATSGQPVYAGLERTIKPQLREVFARLLADDGATLVHCSAGQDRTGVTTALVLTALGVDRATILTDYHLSTALRRPQYELPPLDPAAYPNNPIVQSYAAAARQPGGPRAEPLYARNGESQLAQFFAYLDQTYGGTDAYLAKELGVGPAQVARLRALYTE